MSSIVKLDVQQHADKGYTLGYDFRRAEKVPTVPLVDDEVSSVIAFAPLAFARRQTHAGDVFSLVALFGLAPDKNLFVRSDGRWIAPYTPALFRSWPFSMVFDKDKKQMVLGVDEDGLVPLDGDGAERVLPMIKGGELAPQLKAASGLMAKMSQGWARTVQQCQLLQELDLLTPWDIRYPDVDAAGEREIKSLNGLFHIDAGALSQLDGTQLERLNRIGGLQVAHAQLLSERRVPLLVKLSQAHRDAQAKQRDQQSAADVNLEQLFGQEDDLLGF